MQVLEDPSDANPVEHGLNSRLVLKDGIVQEEVYKNRWKIRSCPGTSMSLVGKSSRSSGKIPVKPNYIRTLITLL